MAESAHGQLAVRVLSDLHLEHAPLRIDWEGEDVLIIAGDVSPHPRHWRELLAHYETGAPDSTIVLLVAGNHDFYGRSVSHHDRVIFVGDLVHKGPNSEDVVRRVMAMRGEVGEVVLVKGNHEEKACKQRLLNLTDHEWSFLTSSVFWYKGRRTWGHTHRARCTPC